MDLNPSRIEICPHDGRMFYEGRSEEFLMAEKTTFEELEQKIKELESLKTGRKDMAAMLEYLFDLSPEMICITGQKVISSM